jgi:hypothetical protein
MSCNNLLILLLLILTCTFKTAIWIMQNIQCSNLTQEQCLTFQEHEGVKY